MRKYIIGGLVGLAIGLSATAYADDIENLIGQKIQGQTAVYLDGSKLDTAIIVDGRSYAPTRKIAEASGNKVTFNEGGIYLETQETPETPVVITDPTPVRTDSSEPSKEDKLNALNTRIDIANVQIQSLKISLTQSSSPEVSAKLQASLTAKEQELADLEQQKAELEAQ